MLLAEKYAIADYNAVRAEDRKAGADSKEAEYVVNAIKAGLPKESILQIFKISAEKYAHYLTLA